MTALGITTRIVAGAVAATFTLTGLGVSLKRSPVKAGMAVSVKMKRVIVESPFKGDRERNKRYLERCLRDCLRRGESPYASHKMLTDCLDDDDPNERRWGIEAGFAWKQDAELTAFYVDLGWSGGMKMGRDFCHEADHAYEIRTLPAGDVFWLEEKRKDGNDD